MKKTIAKIMAAAMVLSTVVAPNVNATTAISQTANGVAFSSLNLAQISATLSGNVNRHDLLNNATVGSRNNPVDAGFEAHYNNGLIDYVESDLYLVGQAPAVDGNLVWFDPANDQVVVQVTDAAVTGVNLSDTDKLSQATATTGGVKVDAADVITNYDLNVANKTAEERRAAILKAVTEGNNASNVDVQNISRAVSNNGQSGTIANNILKTTVSNGIFNDDKYIGGTVFDGGFAIQNDGKIRFVVGTPNAEKTAQIEAAANSTDPIVFKMTMTFGNRVLNRATGALVGERQVWVRLASQEEADYDGFVILHQDNGYNRHIGVNYSIDGSGYATITKANASVLNSDVAKGGRLYLDYVYNRTNTGAALNNQAYKIRTIGSRVFKEGKFQTIAGLGDDGAKYIRTIHNGAFRKCKQLKKVNLDTNKKIRKINSKAFYDCKKLATVKMDARNLKAVGSDAFKNCKSNITFKLKGNSSQVKKAWAKIKKQAPKKAKYSKI